MSIEQVKEIANAVLYEGYLLYPYRQSAMKNRQRWTYGVIYPQEYSQANGSIEPWQMQTECLVSGGTGTAVDVYVRFLHLILCTLEKTERVSLLPSEPGHEWSLASRLADEPREEGVERELAARHLQLEVLLNRPHTLEFSFPQERVSEPAGTPPGPFPGRMIREQHLLVGAITIVAEPLQDNLFKLTVRIENKTPATSELINQQSAIMLHSFISTHTILRAQGGSFVSLLDPPQALCEATKQCVNTHTWPVLAGDEGEQELMLSSPIILYDYPRIAPESPGSLFDGTEIDEMLMLRILTLTDEEKAAMRLGDERVREILERTEQLTPEAFMKLHGTIRSLRPVLEEEPG